MTLGALLLASLALATTSSAPTTPAAAALLPLRPQGSVSVKQARGVSAQLREALDAAEATKLLSETKDDDKQADRCELAVRCLRELAEVRGADLIGAGTVSPAVDGLSVRIVVVEAAGGSDQPLRSVDVTLKGDALDAARLDRLARQAFAPQRLRGSLVVTGEDGARLSLDGKDAGALPLAAPLEDLVEGDHTLLVQKDGYEPFTRTVHVVHRETEEVSVVLVRKAGTTPAAVDDAPRGPPIAAIALSVAAGTLVVGGAVAGGLSFRDGLEAEARAKVDQLVLPRDSGLLLRGQVLALTADALYLAGVAAGAGAVALFVLDGAAASTSDSEPAPVGAAR